MSLLYVTTLVAPLGATLHSAMVSAVVEMAQKAGGEVEREEWLSPERALDIYARFSDEAAAMAWKKQATSVTDADVYTQLAGNARRKKLLISDMDSTIIEQECIDELAGEVGLKGHVAEITERAMRGELDFESALRERVGLLKGLEEAALGRVLAGRITLMSGARELVQTMRSDGALCLLVSGGFTYFTSHIREKVGFHEDSANLLHIENGKLTGTVQEPILGKEAKKQALEAALKRLGLKADAALAIGDGANDLPMIEAAGLGIAYRAKPKVQAAAGARINHGDLRTALYYQGYKDAEIRG